MLIFDPVAPHVRFVVTLEHKSRWFQRPAGLCPVDRLPARLPIWIGTRRWRSIEKDRNTNRLLGQQWFTAQFAVGVNVPIQKLNPLARKSSHAFYVCLSGILRIAEDDDLPASGVAEL